MIELKKQRWTKDQKFKSAPKITRCIEYFNRVCFFLIFMQLRTFY